MGFKMEMKPIKESRKLERTGFEIKVLEITNENDIIHQFLGAEKLIFIILLVPILFTVTFESVGQNQKI